jgi:hypothetical protein
MKLKLNKYKLVLVAGYAGVISGFASYILYKINVEFYSLPPNTALASSNIAIFMVGLLCVIVALYMERLDNRLTDLERTLMNGQQMTSTTGSSSN